MTSWQSRIIRYSRTGWHVRSGCAWSLVLLLRYFFIEVSAYDQSHNYSGNRHVEPSRPFSSVRGNLGCCLNNTLPECKFILLSPRLCMLLVTRWSERVSVCLQLGSWSHLRPPTTCPHLDLSTWMGMLSPRPAASCSPAASFEQEVPSIS